jgi:putative flippase GtrA
VVNVDPAQGESGVGGRARYTSHAAEIVRFALVGVFNTCIDFSIFWLCARVLFLPLVASNFASWIVAFSISFLVNNHWTFRRHHTDFLRWPYYLRVAAGNLASWAVATAVLVQAATHLPLAWAKLLSIAVGFVLNFLIGKFMPLRF